MDVGEQLVHVYCDMDTDGGGWLVNTRTTVYSMNATFMSNMYMYALHIILIDTHVFG